MYGYLEILKHCGRELKKIHCLALKALVAKKRTTLPFELSTFGTYSSIIQLNHQFDRKLASLHLMRHFFD